MEVGDHLLAEQEAHFVKSEEVASEVLTVEKLLDAIKFYLLQDASQHNPTPYPELILYPTMMDEVLTKVIKEKGGEIRIVIRPAPTEMLDVMNVDPLSNNNEYARKS